MKQQKTIHYFKFQNMQHYTKSKLVRDEEGSGFFIRKRVNFKESEDLSKYNSNTEICSIETENKNSKNLFQIISGAYKAPQAYFKLFKTEFKEIVSKLSPSSKSNFFAGDININSLDYSTNRIVRQYLRQIHLIHVLTRS